MAPEELFGKWNRDIIKKEWKIAFFSAFLIGMMIHMPVLLSDIPNHDGLDSMYFDQNMITSGRWFLMAACGFSSFYTIPWLIGVLGLLFLSLAAAALTELLEIRRTWAVVLTGGLLVSFPALASTFAYVFTMDGYMLALLLAVLAVLFISESSTIKIFCFSICSILFKLTLKVLDDSPDYEYQFIKNYGTQKNGKAIHPQYRFAIPGPGRE